MLRSIILCTLLLGASLQRAAATNGDTATTQKNDKNDNVASTDPAVFDAATRRAARKTSDVAARRAARKTSKESFWSLHLDAFSRAASIAFPVASALLMVATSRAEKESKRRREQSEAKYAKKKAALAAKHAEDRSEFERQQELQMQKYAESERFRQSFDVDREAYIAAIVKAQINFSSARIESEELEALRSDSTVQPADLREAEEQLGESAAERQAQFRDSIETIRRFHTKYALPVSDRLEQEDVIEDLERKCTLLSAKDAEARVARAAASRQLDQESL